MPRHPYAIALVAVAASALIRQALDPLFGNDAPLLLFVLGVTLASVRGGQAAGLAATVLSVLVGFYLFVEPRYQLLPEREEDWLRLVVFSIEGVVISIAAGRVLRRTAELDEEVGRRTSELRESNDALEGFAHTISHDLRAPLRSMRGFSEILQEDYAASLPPGAQDCVARILGASHRVEQLVDNLLAYSRLSGRAMPAEPVALAGVVEGALEHLEPVIKSSGARVHVEPSLGTVTGHRDTIEMMVTNLISNAIKFVPAGRTPQVTVSACRDDGHVRLSVRDNGIGVPPAHQQSIFKAFERLHGRAGYAGTGLGLAIVARGAERMRGRCGVNSDGSDGSEFWIELPAARTEDKHGSPDPDR